MMGDHVLLESLRDPRCSQSIGCPELTEDLAGFPLAQDGGADGGRLRMGVPLRLNLLLTTESA